MNRHILVSLMLMVLALMLFNIGGSADQREGGTSGELGSSDDDPSAQSTTLVGEAAAPLPEFSPIGILFAVLLAIIAYWFIRKQKGISVSN